MLQVSSQNLNVNGNSTINDEIIMEMNASSDTHTIWMNVTISDIAKYIANKDAINADFDDFRNIAINNINKMI